MRSLTSHVSSPQVSSAPIRARADWRTLGASTGVGLLLLAAPFERVDAPIALPGQVVTNLEAVLLAALGMWVVASLASGSAPAWRSPLAGPVAALVAGAALAAALAPAEPANAFRAVGRLGAGALVALLAFDAGGWREGVPRLMRVAVVSGTVVGLIAILEYLEVPAVLALLTHFRESAHAVGGQSRMTSTLQYPTITSMYLEVVFALATGLLVLEIDRGRTRAAVIVFAAAALLAEGVALTLTRAGLATMALSLAVVGAGVASKRGLDRASRAVAALAITVAALVGGTLALGSSWLRLTTEGQQGWYRAAFDAPVSLRLGAGVMTRVPVAARNAGRATWSTEADPPFRLSYHWLDANREQVVVFDGLRSAFPADVPPGGTGSVDAWVQAPPRPGRYVLAWDVVVENRLWFGVETPLTSFTEVEVIGDAVGELPPPMPAMPVADERPGRLTLWRLALGMLAERPITGFGLDNFRLLYGGRAGLPRADPRLHTNNMYLELLVGAGILGALPFFWLLWRVASSLGRAWPSVAREELAVYLGLVAAVAAVVAHGLLDSFLTFTPTYLVIWIVIGLAAACASAIGGSRADRV